MKITGLSHLFKWENLHNWWLTKYFFAPLYVFPCMTNCFLYRTSFTNWSVYQGYRCGFSTQFGPATHFSLGKIPPPLRQGSSDSSKQRLQGLCSTTGTFLPPTERSNRGSTAVGHRTRVLQPLLSWSKERRRPEAHSGSTAFEFFPLQREVQDADDENHHVSGPRGGTGLSPST